MGYHTNTDGSLEPVTAAQVYAWMCGVEVDGEHVAVKSGQEVWYKTGDDGEMTVEPGLKAGKTYKAKVKVAAKGDANHKKATEAVTLKVKVK